MERVGDHALALQFPRIPDVDHDYAVGNGRHVRCLDRADDRIGVGQQVLVSLRHGQRPIA